MANAIWLGAAQDVTDVWTVTDTADVDGVAAALVTAWVASQENEHRAWTPTSSGAVFTLTRSEAGVPGVVSSSVSGGTGTIGAAANATAATGSQFWNNTANWSGGALPANGDTVLIDNANPIRYGLNQSAVTLAKLILRGSGDIGLPPITAGGDAEYRDQYLRIGATLVEAEHTSQLTRIDFGTVATTTTVYSTGTPSDGTGLKAMTVKGTNVGNVFNVFGNSSFGVAERLGETANYATLRMESAAGGGDPDVHLGPGVSTVTTTTCSGGTLLSDSNLVTVTCRGGTVTMREATTITSITLGETGTLYHRSSGTITTLVLENGGHADFSGDIRPRTVNNCTMYEGSKLSDNGRSVTFTNPVQLAAGAGLLNVTIDRGTGHTLAA
jgi:hypothetical protein